MRFERNLSVWGQKLKLFWCEEAENYRTEFLIQVIEAEE